MAVAKELCKQAVCMNVYSWETRRGMKTAELGIVNLSNADIVLGTAQVGTLIHIGQRVVTLRWKSIGGLPIQTGTQPVFIITFSQYQS